MSPNLLAVFAVSSLLLAQSPSSTHLLLRNPDVSKTQIVFEYASDLWIVPRSGGEARRLTSGIGHESSPHFSPDGSLVAFSGEYEGNFNIYVVPQLEAFLNVLLIIPVTTCSPVGRPMASPFSSPPIARALTTALNSTPCRSMAPFPPRLPLPMAEDGAFSPDASHIAYSPVFHWQTAWKRLQRRSNSQNLARRSYLIRALSKSLAKAPTTSIPCGSATKSTSSPIAKAPVTLFSYDLASKSVTEVVKNEGLDLKSADATSDAIVYEQFGAIHLLDLATGNSRVVPITLSADLAEVRPHFTK